MDVHHFRQRCPARQKPRQNCWARYRHQPRPQYPRKSCRQRPGPLSLMVVMWLACFVLRGLGMVAMMVSGDCHGGEPNLSVDKGGCVGIAAGASEFGEQSGWKCDVFRHDDEELETGNAALIWLGIAK